jgi:hypothetical protein
MATLLFGIISVLIMAVYTAVMCKKMGRIPFSLSETYYRLEHNKWFGACMSLTGFTWMVAALEVTPENYQFLTYLSFVGMMMISLSPNFKDKKGAIVHYSGTVLVLLCTQAWVVCTHPWIMTVWLLPVAYIIRYISKMGLGKLIDAKPVFWLEIAAFMVIYINLFVLC